MSIQLPPAASMLCRTKNIDNAFGCVLLLWYRQPVARLPPVPSIRHLLRIFLILVLCADGTTGAWAATRMATNQASQAGQASAATKSKSDCDTSASHGKKPASAPAAGQDQHDGCDCGSDASCACGCMLTFHPGRTAPLFAAQHALMSVHPAQPLLPVVPTQVSRLFRPPIY
jgi:hypothetical protein